MCFLKKVTVVFILSLWFMGTSANPSFSGEKSRVFFTAPTDKADISSPVKVTMGAENFTVEPAGVVKPGAGHLHIMVDTDCVAAGVLVPKDATHLHYGKGQMEAELALSPGAHTLCLQAADGAHIALAGDGMTNKIAIVVK
jgi:hypothetical protein